MNWQLYFTLTLNRCLTIIHAYKYLIKGTLVMNAFLIFVVRLILGLVFGIIIIRLFRPEWGIFHGVVAGLILVALAYVMALFRKKKQK